MDFLDLANKRYSVRKYENRTVPEEIIEKILQAGLCAPTAHNNQPQKIIVVNGENGLERLRKCTECHYGAPLAFIISYDKNICWKRSYDGKTSGDIDASIVASHMMLEAASLGLGSTWVMYFIPEAVRNEFGLDENTEPTAILLIGYPAADCRPSPMHSDKRSSEETVIYTD